MDCRLVVMLGGVQVKKGKGGAAGGGKGTKGSRAKASAGKKS